jgi:hypothetical protein
MKRHISYLGAVDRLASSNWGRPDSSSELVDAELAKDPQKLAAWATLGLVHKLNTFAAAVVRGHHPQVSSPLKEKPSPGTPHKSAKVGDTLWVGSLEDGFDRVVVVAKDSDDCILVFRLDCSLEYGASAWWAAEDYFPTIEEAIAASAQEDIEYHTIRLDRAKRAIAAIKAGDDLSEFANPEE